MAPSAIAPKAMITGAGSGLGRDEAALAERGCTLALVDIDAAATEAVAAKCGAAATVILQDLTAESGAEASVDRAIAALGGLDIVVNNAGYGEGQDFFAMRAATWDRTLDLNLRAVALICAAAGRHMRVQRSGRIVNITSPASRMALPNYLAYAASKAGVDAVTRAAAVALAPYGDHCELGRTRNDGYADATSSNNSPRWKAVTISRCSRPSARVAFRWVGAPTAKRSLPRSSGWHWMRRTTSPRNG